jgi:hypothetical protein
MQLAWVRGHSDKKKWNSFAELKDLNLSREETYNVWCDHMAEKEWSSSNSSHFDPEVLGPEKWAVFSDSPVYHKITGCFDTKFYSSIGYKALEKYIHQKHLICPAKLDRVNTQALHNYLSSLNIFQRASIVKLIHNRTLTYSSLCCQGRAPPPSCQRCSTNVKTPDHVLQCPNEFAVSAHQSFLKPFLSSLIEAGTPICIVSTIEYKLSLTLDLLFSQTFTVISTIPKHIYKILLTAICHQNTLGWNKLIHGYSSIYWSQVYRELHSENSSSFKAHWDRLLVEEAIILLWQIWSDRNTQIHGTTKVEAQ